PAGGGIDPRAAHAYRPARSVRANRDQAGPASAGRPPMQCRSSARSTPVAVAALQPCRRQGYSVRRGLPTARSGASALEVRQELPEPHPAAEVLRLQLRGDAGLLEVEGVDVRDEVGLRVLEAAEGVDPDLERLRASWTRLRAAAAGAPGPARGTAAAPASGAACARPPARPRAAPAPAPRRRRSPPTRPRAAARTGPCRSSRAR